MRLATGLESFFAKASASSWPCAAAAAHRTTAIEITIRPIIVPS